MQLTKPIIFFNLETTGTNTAQDRILQIEAVKITRDDHPHCNDSEALAPAAALRAPEKRACAKQKSPSTCRGFSFFSGERGIRTPGTFRYNGFQDRRIKPLCHFSGAKVGGFFKTENCFATNSRKNQLREGMVPMKKAFGFYTEGLK